MNEQPLLKPSENCWRVERADEFAILIDADVYFTAARSAMKAAKRSIFLVGWDFDASVTLGPPDLDDDGPRGVGDFILWLAKRNPDLEIRLLLESRFSFELGQVCECPLSFALEMEQADHRQA